MKYIEVVETVQSKERKLTALKNTLELQEGIIDLKVIDVTYGNAGQDLIGQGYKSIKLLFEKLFKKT